MGFGFPALVVQRGHVGAWIALGVNERGHDSDRPRAKPRGADLIPDFADDYCRWQGLERFLRKPRRAGLGFEPLHLLVVFAVRLDPERPWYALDRGRPSGSRHDKGASRGEVHHLTGLDP